MIKKKKPRGGEREGGEEGAEGDEDQNGLREVREMMFTEVGAGSLLVDAYMQQQGTDAPPPAAAASGYEEKESGGSDSSASKA